MSSKLYKTLDNELVKSLQIKTVRNYYYYLEGAKKDINESPLENSKNAYQLEDIDYEWNNKAQSLFLDVKLSIENTSEIFNNVCYKDTILGIGLEWKPEKSKIKNCIKLGEIRSTENTCVFSKDNIEIKDVNSNINFNWIIYIIKPGTLNGTHIYGNKPGLILGNELLWSIIIEGEGSIFPIYEEAKENGPLWWYYCDFNDITEDEFCEENIRIVLNKLHKSYRYIQPKSPTYNEAMFSELISNAITFLITEIKNKNIKNGNDEKIDMTKESCKGSILTILKYFNNTLNFKINGNTSNLLDSVKLYFDRDY